jgi:hypothetical protein
LKKRIAGLEAQNAGAVMYLKAARKLGEMLAEQIKWGGDRKSSLHCANLKLSDFGIEATASHRWQKLAEIPQEIFEEFITLYQKENLEITTNALWRFYATETIRPLTDEIPLPEGKFRVIVCDPPWPYQSKHALDIYLNEG